MLISSMIINYVWTGVPDVPGKWDEEMVPYESIVIRPWKDKCVIDMKPRNPII